MGIELSEQNGVIYKDRPCEVIFNEKGQLEIIDPAVDIQTPNISDTDMKTGNNLPWDVVKIGSKICLVSPKGTLRIL